MNIISYFLTTEIKAKNISTAETIANFCLTPTQYLWNGKKIDLIRHLDQKAVIFDFIFSAKERTWIKTASMILLLIPGVLLGGAFKAYATIRHHNREDDVFVRKCLKNGKAGTIFSPIGQLKMAEIVRDYITVLQSTGVWNGHLSAKTKPLLLSEIQDIRLLYENYHFSAFSREQWVEKFDQKAAETNRKILDGIHLLWNLRFINAADHYAASLPGKEETMLVEINPSIVSLQVPSFKFTKPIKAKDFFSTL